MWSAEYQQWKRLLRWISSQKALQEARGPRAESFEIANASATPFFGLLQTETVDSLTLFAELTRSYQRASDKTCSDIHDLPMPAESVNKQGSDRSNMLVAVSMPDYRSFFLERCSEDFSLAATQTLIALKAYSIEHQELPATLSALIPNYLESIPIDPFDGEPIRYSLENRVIYSVGADAVDASGIAPPGDDVFLEPHFAIDFLPPSG